MFDLEISKLLFVDLGFMFLHRFNDHSNIEMLVLQTVIAN